MSISSMTGFGTSNIVVMNVPLSIEIRTLNHRFLDLNLRLPRFLTRLEQNVQKAARQALIRGRVDINVNVQSREGENEIFLNLGLAKKYHAALTKLGSQLKILKKNEKPSLELMAGFREIFQEPEGAFDNEKVWQELRPGVEKALEHLIAMRRVEGEALEKELLKRLHLLEDYRAKIAQSCVGLSDRYRDKLKAKIEKIMLEANIDTGPETGRIIQEAALAAERSDITEELERLKSHMQQFESILERETQVGRKLDFLVQEFYREINTIGSKTQDHAVTHLVVEFKTELERIREQIQNIE